MKCDRAKELLVEEWAGTLDSGLLEQFHKHLAACPECSAERKDLAGLWSNIAQLPREAAGPAMKPRFYAMLEGYRQGLSRSGATSLGDRILGTLRLSHPAFRLGLASLLLVAGFLAGYLTRAAHNGYEEMANLRDEVHEMRRMVTLSLLKQQSASERLKGVSWSSTINRPDPEFLNTLLRTVEHDPNVDVRLAAVDALSRFAGQPMVKQDLTRLLAKQDSPMVQIALIDLLVQLHERQSIGTLQQIAADTRRNESVRQRARWGLQILS